MKKIILLLVIVSSTLSVNAQKEMKIDTSRSVIKWTGSDFFKINKHYGTVKFKSGEVVFKSNLIIGGKFKIDMNSIINTDGEYSTMLVGHLKNNDFFDVGKHPFSELEILSLKYIDNTQIDVEANLTIKGITKKINYKTTLKSNDDEITMNSTFSIDRTRWGVNYESRSFMVNLKDDAISDEIDFEVIITVNIK